MLAAAQSVGAAGGSTGTQSKPPVESVESESVEPESVESELAESELESVESELESVESEPVESVESELVEASLVPESPLPPDSLAELDSPAVVAPISSSLPPSPSVGSGHADSPSASKATIRTEVELRSTPGP